MIMAKWSGPTSSDWSSQRIAVDQQQVGQRARA